MAVKKAKQAVKKEQKFGFNQEQFEMKKFLEILCNIGVYLFLFFLVVVFSFYFKDGYTQIATRKFGFFKEMCIISGCILVPLAGLWALVKPRFGEQKELGLLSRMKIAVGKWSVTDWAVLAYLVVNVLSYLATPYKEEALWGTSGWYMGLCTQICFMGIYFFLSRFYDGKLDIYKYMMWTTFVVFGWGLLNRFSVYPIEMENSGVAFISSLGNINWFCGYWSVFFGIGVVLYWLSEELWDQICLGIYCVVALGISIVEGSDSGYIALLVVFLVIFFQSFKSTRRMERFLELCIGFLGMCQVERMIYGIWPDSLNMYEGMIVLLLSNLTLVLLVVFIGLRIWIQKADAVFQRHTQVPGVYFMQKLQWLRMAVSGLLLGVLVLYIVLLTLNTLRPGSLGALSQNGLFIFDGNWGSARGTTWMDGFMIFGDFSVLQKLIGAGPDCFAAYAFDKTALAAIITEQFGGARLTNAHNECITLLTNVGILGLSAFVCSFVGTAVRCFRKAAEDPMLILFAACLLSYFFHNMFSFEQITNVPFAFMMLGLAENRIRHMSENTKYSANGSD